MASGLACRLRIPWVAWIFCIVSTLLICSVCMLFFGRVLKYGHAPVFGILLRIARRTRHLCENSIKQLSKPDDNS